MKFSYNWLQSYFNKKLPKPEKIAELLTIRSFEVESAEKIGNDYLFDIDILPNRTHDCLSHWGVAKELAALLKLKTKSEKFKVKEDKKLKIADYLNIRVEEQNLCQRYLSRIIFDVKVGPSPKWLKEKLETLGQKPINNIVDATNYVMFALGQPTHIFDFDKIKNMEIRNPKQIQNLKIKTIIVRKAEKGESVVGLDNIAYLLDENVLVIAAIDHPRQSASNQRESAILAIAGIKGGKKAEIDKNTKNIILEAANFNPSNIRGTSRRLGLKTDSSIRFEAGLDPNLAENAIDYLAGLILKIAGGKLAGGKIDFYQKKEIPKIIYFSLEEAEKIIGLKFKEKQVIEILNSLGIKISARDGSAYDGKKEKGLFKAEIPTIRQDLTIKEDIFEEIARIYGYENLPATLPSALLIPAKENEELKFEKKTKEILTVLGFSEVYNYSFNNSKEIKSLELFAKTKESKSLMDQLVYLKNPIALDKDVLRPTLIINLIKTAENNLKFFDKIKIFEIGKIFKYADMLKYRNVEISKCREIENNILEKKMISGLISYKRGTLLRKGTLSNSAKEFYDLKGAVTTMAEKLGIGDIWFDNFKETPEDSLKYFWHKGRSAEIKAENKEIGFIGEINPKILDSFGIKERIALFEIDFNGFFQLTKEELEYQPLPKFPSIIRDLAIVVDLETKVDDVLNVIENAGGKLLYDTDLFDIYEGENLPAGKKSLAFRLIFQSLERTLSDSEIDLILKNIVKLIRESGWEIR